jgi:hypothetical protein
LSEEIPEETSNSEVKMKQVHELYLRAINNPLRRKILKVPEMEEVKHLCPSCGAELVQLRYYGDPNDLPDKAADQGGAWLDPTDWVEKQCPVYRDG